MDQLFWSVRAPADRRRTAQGKPSPWNEIAGCESAPRAKDAEATFCRARPSRGRQRLLKLYDDETDNPRWIKVLANVRHMAACEGWSHQHMQATIVAIDQHAEAALGNREYFLNMPHGIGWKGKNRGPLAQAAGRHMQSLFDYGRSSRDHYDFSGVKRYVDSSSPYP
jgi:hypothetical protein